MDKLFLTAAAGIGAFFGLHGNASTTPPDRHNTEVHATTSAKTSLNIACVAAAVAAREASLQIAITANAGAISSAYGTRASALASAYAQTDQSAIKAAVRSAWTTFGAALRVAHKGWITSQQAAWSSFKTALKACGPGATSVADSTSASVDASAGGGTSQ